MPADDLTDPAPATTFAHLDATTVLSRQIAEMLGKEMFLLRGQWWQRLFCGGDHRMVGWLVMVGGG